MDIPAVFANIGDNHQTRFLLSNTVGEEDGAIVFITDTALQWLADNRKWHFDGTFKAAPRQTLPDDCLTACNQE